MKNVVRIVLLAVFAFSAISVSANAPGKKLRVLFVLTSHSELGTTGKPTGFWIEEFATPYYFLKDRGVEVVVASPKGGQAPIDPKSNEPAFQTASTKRYFADADAQKVISNTVKLSTIVTNKYDAVFYPGGHGPMWDLAEDPNSIRVIQEFYYSKKPIAFVCHGSAALVNVKDVNGKYIIDGKRLTGFCNSEEMAVQLTQVVPFSLEDKLRECGGLYEKGADWSSFVVEDGQLITGQNPQSSEQVAQRLYERLTGK